MHCSLFMLPVKNNKALLHSELPREESNCMTLSCHLLHQPVHRLSGVAEDHRLQAVYRLDVYAMNIHLSNSDDSIYVCY